MFNNNDGDEYKELNDDPKGKKFKEELEALVQKHYPNGIYSILVMEDEKGLSKKSGKGFKFMMLGSDKIWQVVLITIVGLKVLTSKLTNNDSKKVVDYMQNPGEIDDEGNPIGEDGYGDDDSDDGGYNMFNFKGRGKSKKSSLSKKDKQFANYKKATMSMMNTPENEEFIEKGSIINYLKFRMKELKKE